MYDEDQKGEGDVDFFLDSLGLRKELKQYVFMRKINIALQIYNQCGSVMETVCVLDYPTGRALYTWIGNEGPKTLLKEQVNINTAHIPEIFLMK